MMMAQQEEKARPPLTGKDGRWTQATSREIAGVAHRRGGLGGTGSAPTRVAAGVAVAVATTAATETEDMTRLSALLQPFDETRALAAIAAVAAAAMEAMDKARMSAELQLFGEPTVTVTTAVAAAAAAVSTTLGGAASQGNSAKCGLSAKLRALAEPTAASAAVATATAAAAAAFTTLAWDFSDGDTTGIRALPTEESSWNRSQSPPSPLSSLQRMGGRQGWVILPPRACRNKAQAKAAALRQFFGGEQRPPPPLVDPIPPASSRRQDWEENLAREFACMAGRFAQEKNAAAAEAEAQAAVSLVSTSSSVVANRTKSPLAAVSAAAETLWWWVWRRRRSRGRRPRRRKLPTSVCGQG